MSQNARMLSEVIIAAGNLSKQLMGAAVLASRSSVAGVRAPLDRLGISKSSVTSVTFNEVQRGNKSSLVEAKTDEILGGIGARFTFAGTDVKAIAKTVGEGKVLQELGHQGFRMTSVKEKSGFPQQLPQLERPDLQLLSGIVVDVDKAYKALTVIQDFIVSVAGELKKTIEATEPVAWQNLSKQDIAVMQAQLNFSGLLETSLATGYRSMSDQVNNFRNAYVRLTQLYVSE